MLPDSLDKGFFMMLGLGREERAQTRQPAFDVSASIPFFAYFKRKAKNSYRILYRKIKFFWHQSNFWAGRQVTAKARFAMLQQIEEKSGLVAVETASPNSLYELEHILENIPNRSEIGARFPHARVLLLGHAVDVNLFQMRAFGDGWCSGNLHCLNPPVKPASKHYHWWIGNEIFSLARQLAHKHGGTVLTGACDQICHGNPHQNRLDTVKEISAESVLYRLPDVVLINSGDYERVFNIDLPTKKFFKVLSESKGEVNTWLHINGLYKDENRNLHHLVHEKTE
jgi:hypothetical protein